MVCHSRVGQAGCRRWLTALVLMGLVAGVGAQGQSGYHQAYEPVDELNSGLSPLQPPVNLSTPQASLENFLLASEEEDFQRAAHSLNLNRLPADTQAERGPELARKLYYVFNQKVWVDWSDISDRSDGLLEKPVQEGKPRTEPRRSIVVGEVSLHGRDKVIRLQRVKSGERDPVWVFSPRVTDSIDALYQAYGPTWLDRQLPDWARIQLMGHVPLWQWVLTGVFGILAVGCGMLARRLVNRALRHRKGEIPKGLARDLPGPAGVLVGLVVFYVCAISLLTLSGPVTRVMGPIVTVLIVAAFTWAGMRAIGFLADYWHNKFIASVRADNEDRARRLMTNISVARRVLIFIALLAGVGIGLKEFGMAESLGLSLLASAGVLGIIVGVAAHNVLANIMGGVQIAITQPVRIGDTVLFEGEWGYIEEITYTYITIRSWDERRLVVPLNYFLNRPVENWSKTHPGITKAIHLYVDYHLDVARVRRKYHELLEQAEEWDRQIEPTLQVTMANEETMELRALCSAADPDAAWSLQCRLREQLIAYIQDLEWGRYLPRRRVVLQDSQVPAPTPMSPPSA